MTEPLFNWDEITGKFYSNGWKTGAKTAEVIEPATGKSLAQVGLGSAEQISQAAEIAAIAQKQWQQVPPEEKRAILIRADATLHDFADEIRAWTMREIGATRSKAQFEINFCSDEFLEAAAYPTQHRGALLGDRANRMSYAVRVPYGVVAALTPSNVPLLLAARVIAPALATGNAVLLRPHPSSIVCGGFIFARIFEAAGLPPGLLHIIPARGKDAEVFETDPNISMIHFTGSSATGQRIAEAASRLLKKVSISGSGKNPFIVLDDVEDMEALISTAVYSTFYFGGQSCMTAGRHLVHRSLVNQYIQRFVEVARQLTIDNPLTNPNAFYGPMIQPESVHRQDEIVKDAVAKGATLHLGGKFEGAFFYPTVLSEVKPGMQAWDEEIFGPIAAITTFDTDEEAIQLANDTPYGLSSAVFGSPTRATRVAEQLQTGMVHINDRSTDDSAYVPFGGMKLSGNGGRYGSGVNWDEYTQWRWFTISEKPSLIPLGH
jgi:benzaldehyde dehydrogenase (NAD)